MKDKHVGIIIFFALIILIPTILGFHFWYYEPMTNPNNFIKTFYNYTSFELSERKIVNVRINEIIIKDDKPMFCEGISRCIILNMTNPLSYVGKTVILQVDTLLPICHQFDVWENGTVIDMGKKNPKTFSENYCYNPRQVANLPDTTEYLVVGGTGE